MNFTKGGVESLLRVRFIPFHLPESWIFNVCVTGTGFCTEQILAICVMFFGEMSIPILCSLFNYDICLFC